MNEKEIKYLMDKYQLTRDEAVQMWREDNELETNAEIEEMTAKAKEVRRYEKADKNRKKTTREPKVDEEKKMIIEYLFSILAKAETLKVGLLNIVNPQQKIDFLLNGNHYTISLTKHRPKK